MIVIAASSSTWLAPPIGYANGISVAAGQMVFIAGQVGWDAEQHFHSEQLVPQFEQALKNYCHSRAGWRRGNSHLPDYGVLYRQAGLPR